MPLIKINKDTYINSEHIIQIVQEKDKDSKGLEVGDKAWTIYTELGKIKVDKGFKLNEFLRESKCH